MLRFEISDESFEYDVRTLTNEFFPGTKEALPAILRVSRIASGFEISLGEKKLSVDAADKNELKIALYDFLAEHTGRTLPWGALTGVRPVKLAREKRLERYRVSPEKMALAKKIAKKEDDLIEKCSLNPESYSVYIGIPFCPSRCLYCSFTSFPIDRVKGQVAGYLDALIQEITAVSSYLPHRRPTTIYVGGGTPTALSAPELERLLFAIGDNFEVDSVRECCVECGRPDSITEEKLKIIRNAGFVNRISVNPQTMNGKTLEIIGRRHTVEDVVEKFGLARSLGFSNINMDIIAGLPGEGIKEMEQTLSMIRELSPESLTVHSLAIKRAAMLNLHISEYEETLGHDTAQQLSLVPKAVDDLGMEPYYLYRQKNMAGNFENVGYARVGCECLYNILIMEEVESIYAFGAGSSTKRVFGDGRIKRIEDPKDINQYTERLTELIGKKETLINE